MRKRCTPWNRCFCDVVSVSVELAVCMTRKRTYVNLLLNYFVSYMYICLLYSFFLFIYLLVTGSILSLSDNH